MQFDFTKIDQIISDAKKKQETDNVENLKKILHVSFTLVQGLRGELKDLQQEETRLKAQREPLERKMEQLVSHQKYITEKDFADAKRILDDYLADTDMHLENVQNTINEKVMVQLYEAEQKFKEQKDQIQKFPLELRFSVEGDISDITVKPDTDSTIQTLAEIKEWVKSSGVLTKTKKKAIAAYGNMPSQSRDMLFNMFQLQDVTITDYWNLNLATVAASKHTCLVVIWFQMSEIGSVITACEASGVPYVVVSQTSKQKLASEVCRALGHPLPKMKGLTPEAAKS